MPAIFISYRRGYSNGEAGRLFEAISGEFGRRNVFMDVVAIQPGVDFRRSIEQIIASCDMLIEVIGQDWLGVTDTEGHRWIDNPNDFVRLEVAPALLRNSSLVPVLAQAAAPLSEMDLPADVKKLLLLRAETLSHAKWERGVLHLSAC